jgi:hypothetical protein
MNSLQWVTPAGILFTATPTAVSSFTIEATSASSYSLISGSLPAGLSFSSTGTITGTPTGVLTATISQFVIRARNSSGVLDRTFKISVDGNTEPLWSTPEGALPIGYGGTAYLLNNQWLSYNLGATDLSTSTIIYSLVAGVLPPGLTLNENGTISGFVNDTLTFDGFGIAPGAYDSGKFDGYGYDPVLTFAGNIVVVKLTSQPKTYQFTVSASDGYLDAKRDFRITVVNPNMFRADNVYLDYDTSILSTDIIPANVTPTQVPQFLNNSNLGVVRADNNIDIDVSAYDVTPLDGTMTYAIITGTDVSAIMPEGLMLDEVSGHIYGYLPYQPAYTRTYNITVSATKYNNLTTSTITAINTFTLMVAGNVFSSIEWVSDSDLGSIEAGNISELYVQAKEISSNYNINYTVTNGLLPPGLTLAQDGTITGKAIFGVFGEFTFTILASDVYGLSGISKEFKLTVNTISGLPYTEIYVRPFLSRASRTAYQEFISNKYIFDPSLIYRYFDSNFGVQSDIKMYLEYGIEERYLDEYANSMVLNFYRRPLCFGELKVAVAQNSNKETVYEAVYVDIVDGATNSKGDSAPYRFEQKGKVYNPSSVGNMQQRFETIPLLMNNGYRKIGTNEYNLPLFMRTPQGSDYNPSNYIPVVVLCYALPGQGTRIANRIRRSNFDFKQFNFEIDRVIVANSLDNTTDKYLLFQRQHITDVIPSDNTLTGIEGLTLN